MIEPAQTEFEKPNSPYSIDLDGGIPHAVVYYAQGTPGQKFNLSGKAGGTDLFDAIDRVISSTGFAYGHKAFTP